MADLSITAGSVVGYGPRLTRIAGGTITAGQPIRVDASGNVVAASDDSAANAAVAGIALNGGSAGQPISYQEVDLMDLGATLAVGKPYVLSTSGGIAPVDDIAGGEYVTMLGIATAADRLKLGINASGVAAAGAVA